MYRVDNKHIIIKYLYVSDEIRYMNSQKFR